MAIRTRHLALALAGLALAVSSTAAGRFTAVVVNEDDVRDHVDCRAVFKWGFEAGHSLSCGPVFIPLAPVCFCWDEQVNLISEAFSG
ncbi:hypothetical protein SCLCIDRAFT_1219725 [Scleroderma citrinum Foug A]|uniref:Uncharacterized protein n=1 Tax=Scleroderma citrinum Foug A TaxID=1036808 RepID=A0A0C3DLC7_9AGAM|nr:hypothetical protein SCLCIDRAFT_1219725 [Scleroderma citrinum Foug A]